MLIPNFIAAFMTNNSVVQVLPGLKFPGEILSILVSVAQCVLLFLLAKEEKNYGYAAWAAAQGRSTVFRPVNRIDKDTSGLVLAARNSYAAPLLAQGVEKLYYAIVEGELPLGPGVIDAPIGRQGDSIIGRCVTPEGKPSRTEYTILKAKNGLSLAACVPVTGRTHQIRVHFASLGHPLAGDDLYGGHRERVGRQALHCAKQTYTIPAYTPMPDGIVIDWEAPRQRITVESPLPADLQALLTD